MTPRVVPVARRRGVVRQFGRVVRAFALLAWEVMRHGWRFTRGRAALVLLDEHGNVRATADLKRRR